MNVSASDSSVTFAEPFDEEKIEQVLEALEAKCSPTGCDCCERADEYNGFGSDGPTIFTCPKHCPCHD